MDQCPHETTVSYEIRDDTHMRCCLDCGYTEIRVAGIVVKRYFQAPVVFGFLRKSLTFIEDIVKKTKNL
jgi:hypothetical protein